MASLAATGVHFSLLASFSFSELVRCFQFLGMDASRLCSWWVDLVVVVVVVACEHHIQKQKDVHNYFYPSIAGCQNGCSSNCGHADIIIGNHHRYG